MLYTIYRYYIDTEIEPELLASGQTLEEAELHCGREDTRLIDEDNKLIWVDYFYAE